MTKYSNEEFLDDFDRTIKKMSDICKSKNADYAGNEVINDPFANFKMVESLGITDTERGLLTRMTDKMARITTFVQKGVLNVKDESVEDTLVDLANYAIILKLYIHQKKKISADSKSITNINQ